MGEVYFKRFRLYRQRLSNHAKITFNEDNIQRQYFAFPYPHMCYIRENADDETQLKLRQTCKFFHKWNPKLIVKNLFFGRDPSPDAGKWDLYVRNFEEMPMIDVITNGIFCDAYDIRMISKINRCEAKDIETIFDGEISMKEFLFFTKSGMVKDWLSPCAKIRDVNGKLISLDDLLLRLPNAINVYANVQDVTHENSSKIAAWNNTIQYLVLYFHGPINVDHFYELLQKILAPGAHISIYFIGLTDETYIATLDALMEAKMNAWKPQNEKPLHSFIYSLL